MPGCDMFILRGDDWGGWAVGAVWFGQRLLRSVNDISSVYLGELLY